MWFSKSYEMGMVYKAEDAEVNANPEIAGEISLV
jgi:hypothetical protein